MDDTLPKVHPDKTNTLTKGNSTFCTAVFLIGFIVKLSRSIGCSRKTPNCWVKDNPGSSGVGLLPQHDGVAGPLGCLGDLLAVVFSFTQWGLGHRNRCGNHRVPWPRAADHPSALHLRQSPAAGHTGPGSRGPAPKVRPTRLPCSWHLLSCCRVQNRPGPGLLAALVEVECGLGPRLHPRRGPVKTWFATIRDQLRPFTTF